MPATMGENGFGVIIINTVRGAHVDEAALVRAIEREHVGGAGLDTFQEEPLPSENSLRGLENFVLTPHLAASTKEAQHDAGVRIVQQVIATLTGAECENAVNAVIQARVVQEVGQYLLFSPNA